MPSRPVCAAILLFWAYAAGALFRRDLLPDLWTVPPPDLRAVVVAEGGAPRTEPVANWNLSIPEDSANKGYRPVGRATTQTVVDPDGTVNLIGTVTFDTAKVLRGTPFAPREVDTLATPDSKLVVANVCRIDRTGQLASFRAEVRSEGETGPALLTLDGRAVEKAIEVKATGPIPLLNWTRRFPYESRGMIQNAAGPIDRLPGLQVGQRWETRVVSPLTGRVESAQTRVEGRHLIPWDNQMIPTLMVVTQMASITTRTWVRPDGLVIKQEIPSPFVKLILERDPGRGGRAPAQAESGGGGGVGAEKP